MALPPNNLRLVAQGGALVGLLARETQPTKQVPQMAGTVFHAKLLGDDFADTWQRP